MAYVTMHLLVFAVLLFFSAFFSGAETALFSIKKAELYRFSNSPKITERTISSLMTNPDGILATLLLGNLFVNLSLTAVVTNFLLGFFGDYGHLISIAIVTPLIIILSEITPKLIAVNLYMNLLSALLPFLLLFHKVFYPARILLMKYTDMLTKIFKLELKYSNLTEDELKYVVASGEKKGILDKSESDIIKNVISFSRKEASNIMYPRNEAVFISYGASIESAMELCLENDIIRLPVYKDDYDNIVGFVDSRDLMSTYLGYKKRKSINSFIRPIDFFPFSKDLNELLRDFLLKKIQIAVVVDEYGGTAGIVTLNSILSSLLGKNFGKWGNYKKNQIRTISEGRFIVSGNLQLDEFNSFFNVNLESVNSDTIGGFVVEKLNALPARGMSLEISDLEITVRHVSKRKIISLEVFVKEREA